MSIVWANLLGALWAKTLSMRTPEVGKTIFVDDKSIRTHSREDFEKAIRITTHLDLRCGLKLNVDKVKLLCNCPKTARWATRLKFQDQSMSRAKCETSLGTLINLTRGKITKKEKRALTMPDLWLTVLFAFKRQGTLKPL